MTTIITIIRITIIITKRIATRKAKWDAR